MLKFRVHEHVTDADVVAALRSMLYINETEDCWELDLNRWRLDSTNNTWLYRDGDRQYKLNFRYHDAEFTVAFATVFARCFGAKILTAD